MDNRFYFAQSLRTRIALPRENSAVAKRRLRHMGRFDKLLFTGQTRGSSGAPAPE